MSAMQSQKLTGAVTKAHLHKLMHVPLLLSNLRNHAFTPVLGAEYCHEKQQLHTVFARATHGSLGALIRARLQAGMKGMPFAEVGAFAVATLRGLRDLEHLGLMHGYALVALDCCHVSLYHPALCISLV